MAARTKKQVAPYVPLLRIAVLLALFGFGLLVAFLFPGVVVALLVLVLVVLLALLGYSFNLWQAGYKKQLSKPVRLRKSLPKMEVTK